MTKYILLYLILLIASLFAMFDLFFEWLENEGTEYNLFNKQYDLWRSIRQ